MPPALTIGWMPRSNCWSPHRTPSLTTLLPGKRSPLLHTIACLGNPAGDATNSAMPDAGPGAGSAPGNCCQPTLAIRQNPLHCPFPLLCRNASAPAPPFVICMSNQTDLEFDLEKLFLPSWAKTDDTSRYAKFEGGDRPERDRDRRGGDRGPRGDRRGGPVRRDG